jgi:peptidoglycan/LPS O-acetylase OafA/YrhL
MNEFNLSNENSKEKIERIYFPELDGLRFFAFLLVFIHHHDLFLRIPYLSILHTHGWIGVDLFFALSSFLFTKLLITEYQNTETINFKKFYIRRVFRIWPIYFLFIIFAISLYLFTSNGVITKNIALRLVGLLAFSDNIMTAIFGYNPIPFTAHLWTITYEEQFYIFIPLIILLLVRSSAKVKIIAFLSIFILLNCFRIFLIEMNAPHPAIWVLPITHFESIIIGMVIGFGGGDFLLLRIKPLTFALFGILFFILLSMLPNIDNISYLLIVNYSLVGLTTSMVLFSVLNSDCLKKIFSREYFVFLGKRSYGLYLYHLLGNGTANYISKKITLMPVSLFVSFFLSLAFTIIVSIISYKIIETPFLKLKRKFEVVISRPI